MTTVLELNPLLPIALFSAAYLLVVFFREHRGNAVLLFACLAFAFLIASPQGRALQKQTNNLPGFANKWRCFSGTLFSASILSKDAVSDSESCRYKRL